MRERERRRVGEQGRGVCKRESREAPPRPLRVFLMLFQAVLHTQTHAPPLGTHWEEFSPSLSRGRSSKSHRRTEVWSRVVVMMMMIEGVVCALPLCTCSAVHNCALAQMERMQGGGGGGVMEPLEEPSPLTDKEKVMIQDSWAKVYQSCDDAGVAILVR